MAVGAILLTLAVPSINTFVKNNRLTSQTNELVAHINLARLEALKRSRLVILCRSGNPNASPPACGGSGNIWTTGWLVYATNAGTTSERNYNSGTDTLLAIGQGATKTGVAIIANTVAGQWLAYGPTGALVEAGAARYAFCDDRNEAKGRLVEIELSGRPTIRRTGASGTATDCTPT
jgi:type IV fimbrial biogenesis protein FimT